jgi:branched-chain amino acid transport system substrate-binding protein
MRRRFVGLAVLVVTLGVAVVGLPTVTDSGEPVRIGVIYNTSGGMKWLDQPGLEGMQLAVGQVNGSGGVLGRSLETVEVDGTTDITKIRDLASDLVMTEDLVTIVGVNDPVHAVAPIRGALRRADGGLITFSQSEMALAVGEVTEGAGMPFLTAGSTLSGLPQLVDGLFMVAADHQAGAEAIADYTWDELGGRSAVILVDSGHEYTTGLAGSFERRWLTRGGEVLGSGSYSAGELEISSQIGQVRELASQPDIIYVASLPNDGGYLVRQLRDAGLSQPVLFADVVDPRYIAAMAGDLENVYMATHGSLIDPHSDIREFIQAYESEHGHTPDGATSMLGYDTIRLIANAIEQAGSLDSRLVSASLAATNGFDALTGELSYPDGTGSPAKTITIVSYDTAGVARVAARIEPPPTNPEPGS